jgi:hypothetical protein
MANMKRIKNGISYDINGWKYISIHGLPRDRGYAHGYLAANNFKRVKRMLEFVMFNSYGLKWSYFIDLSTQKLKPTIVEHFPELYEEMLGITEGCNHAGCTTTIDEIIAWNNYFTLDQLHSGGKGRKEGGAAGQSDKCSAFIANGDWTEDGKIVVAHNSFTNFIDGQYENIILDIWPTHGHRILMQTNPCFIWSGTDFFITSKGIVGTETTIGGFNKYENKYTIGCRIRKAMQYGNTLDDYTKILLDGNSGDYANSWLFGNIHTNEILRIELGLKYHNTERTKNGYFIGFNATYDPRIRNLECADSGFDDIRRHQGARRVRLADLMDKHKGKINIAVAQEIISDHYDVYLNKDNKCSRTVCGHYELDAREYMSDPSRPVPFQPRGAVDGCVADSNLVSKMSFMGRWGSSCGTAFKVAEFCDKNRQWAYLKPYLDDRLSQPWTLFSVLMKLGRGQRSRGKIKKTKTLKKRK